MVGKWGTSDFKLFSFHRRKLHLYFTLNELNLEIASEYTQKQGGGGKSIARKPGWFQKSSRSLDRIMSPDLRRRESLTHLRVPEDILSNLIRETGCPDRFLVIFLSNSRRILWELNEDRSLQLCIH